MSQDLELILGPTQYKKLTKKRDRAPGQFNDVLSATESLIQAHCQLLSLVWQNLPRGGVEDCEEALLFCGEAAEHLKKTVRAAIRGGK